MEKRMLPGWAKAVVFFASGIVMALPLPFPSLFFLAYLGFIPPAVIEMTELFRREKPVKKGLLKAYLRGAAFFYGYGLVGFVWFLELYPLDFLDFTKGQALFVVCLAWFGLSLLQTVFSAFLFVLLHLVFRLSGAKETWFPLAAATLWPLFEYLQTLTWAGVPWEKLALGQTSFLPVIQSSSLLGPYFVSFLIILVGGSLALAVFRFLAGERKRAALAAGLALAVFLLNVSYGTVRLLVESAEGQDVKAAAIQANISSKDKWNSEKFIRNSETYLSLSEEALKAGAQIVLWPESAIPTRLEYLPDTEKGILELAKEYGGEVFVGSVGLHDGDDVNQMILARPDGTFDGSAYYKRHLVPFGEYVPWRDFFEAVIPDLIHMSMADTDFVPGQDASLFETEYGKVGCLICFDSIYEPLARDSVRAGAQLLTVSTNDSWFGDSSGVWEHERHSVLRAVENGRYVLRAGNTGVSAVISDRGVIEEELEPLVSGVLSGNVRFLSYRTLYTVVGDVVLPLCLGFLVFLSLSGLIRRKKHHAD
ncbi:MAG: apolipoprotein N-acyltransferase [Clostridia bacterium]|nr:apolipoprotein N-acyltransferase [Clostridia bacterium]